MKRLLRSLLTLGIVGVASAPGATANDGFTRYLPTVISDTISR